MSEDAAPPRVLTIAGSDPSGGAGLQADLKTFHAFGCYGMAVVTALTAQNTVGVRSVHAPPASFVADQLHAIFDDCPPAAIKTGMLYSAEIVDVVASVLAERCRVPLVVDPVAVATSGDPLLHPDAIQALCERLIPLASLVTPNTSEALLLTGAAVDPDSGPWPAACAMLELGAAAVLLKGGHASGEDGTLTDHLYERGCDEGSGVHLGHPRVDLDESHGTGCTLSAAIAAELGRGRSLHTSVERARAFVRLGLEHAFGVGAGAVPVNHLREAPDGESE